MKGFRRGRKSLKMYFVTELNPLVQQRVIHSLLEIITMHNVGTNGARPLQNRDSMFTRVGAFNLKNSAYPERRF